MSDGESDLVSGVLECSDGFVVSRRLDRCFVHRHDSVAHKQGLGQVSRLVLEHAKRGSFIASYNIVFFELIGMKVDRVENPHKYQFQIP